MIIESSFKPLWWMANPHAQTIYASLRHPIKAPVSKTERIDLPDGDFINLAWATADLGPETPLIIILHGLAGCVNSSYVARFMKAFNNRGWRAVLMHFRGAGEEPNRLARSYHSGDTNDVDYLVSLLHKREPNTKKAIVGVSMGGNILLKWLGEQGQQSRVQTAVAVSVPYILKNAANRINVGFSRLYQARLLNQLKPNFMRKLHMVPNPPEALKEVKNCTCFWTFDHKVTAPLNGFTSVHAYYRESSSRQYLPKIKTPTLLIHAKDDPFMTPDVLPSENELSDYLVLEVSEKGGHVGFITSGNLGTPEFWLDQRIPEYFESQFKLV